MTISNKNQSMKISILFATYNGEKRLPVMLDAFTELDYPQEQWQVIAVNNNSSDSTLEVLESYKDKLPLTVLTETKQGKSHALNLGLEHVKSDSDLIILTDDDIIADPRWLQAYVEAAQAHSDFQIFGGEIRPAWEKQPPQWILDWVNLRMLYAINQGTEEGEINPDLVFGPNSCFRAALFLEKGNRIPTHIGPKSGGAYPMGNDSMLAKILSDQGYKAYQVPDAIVGHMIPAKNLEEDWIIRRAERFGWGMVVQHPEWFDEYRLVSLRWLRRRIQYVVFLLLFYPAKYLLPRSERRFKLLYWTYYLKGVFRGIKNESAAD